MNYPKEQIEFLQAVYDMRDAQRDFFAQPNDYRKKVAIAREIKLDALMRPFIDAGIIIPKLKQVSELPSLFNNYP